MERLWLANIEPGTTDDELQEYAAFVRQYKELRPLMHRLHRLPDSSGYGYRLLQYSSDAGGVLFAFLPESRIGHGSTMVRVGSAIFGTRAVKPSRQ